MSTDGGVPVNTGSVTLTHDEWRAVMAALEGDASRRDDALDALQRWAPDAWLEDLP